MRFGRNKIDPSTIKAIEEDMAEIDKKEITKTASVPKGSDLTPCNCSGGPGKAPAPEKRGTGLIDDYTLCPVCNGTGFVEAAQG